MKTQATRSQPAVATPPTPAQPKRRQLVVGAGVAAGTAIAAAAALRARPEAPAEVAAAGPQPARQDGYRLTDHVSRYYETTRS